MNTPREIDTALAEIWREMYRAEDQLDRSGHDLLRLAGAKFYYRGRRLVTDMKLDEALVILAAEIERLDAYKAAHRYVDGDYVGTDWSEWHGITAPYDSDRPARALEMRRELIERLDELQADADKLEARYTGWSRYFLVTSSAGHIHSSTHCSTCRPTTRYGWLPELSGRTETDAVGELGPTLCSVCFPSAPVDWTTGKKITAAQAAKKAA